ncbi:MAG TPA: hypothetical protein VJM10_02690 [Candidatus Methylomirabilis sp.]|nr:hypothetical protein [Candidatus Methylomirabilis sp.]
MTRVLLWKSLALALVAAVIASSGLTAYFYQRSVFLESENQTLGGTLEQVSDRVDLLVDYGNGTKEWNNGTRIPLGSSVFNATVVATGSGVEYSVHPQLGVFITGIRGVKSDSATWWSLWRWDRAAGGWMLSEVGAAELLLHDGEAAAWKLVNVNVFPPPPP